MARVYIETSVPSFYFDTRRTLLARAWREATRAWWPRALRRYELVTSAFVIAELAQAREPKRREALGLLDGVERLDMHPKTARVIDTYLRHRVMPRDALGDAAHLAACSLHGVEFLVTWNCKHLANANKFGHIAAVNRSLGLACPILVTPLSLMKADSP